MSADRPTAAELVQATAFVRRVIFKRWASAGTGPEAFSCWGLARTAQRELAGINLPLVDVDERDVRAVVQAIAHSPLRADWLDVDSPRHLDLVTMSHSRRSHHIGVYMALEGGGVLHAYEQFDTKGNPVPSKPAVFFQRMHMLPLGGWSRLTFLRHRKGGA